ncbi:MAG: peptidoglycan glycosyltransferase [Candidatus Peregrinibacteria bacterium Gr01-1014_25]|nr:MAG: peptidoglycan glycosyltransferase [Candidatus Peregrinibacteria bacterium Gr01-1014_25]
MDFQIHSLGQGPQPRRLRSLRQDRLEAAQRLHASIAWARQHPRRIAAICAVALAGYLSLLWLTLPDISDPRALIADTSSVITDRNGTELYRLYKEEDRTFIPGEQIPAHVKEAIIAIEDERFYTRGCLDIRAIARAFFRFGQAGGASTLTRQLARNALNLKRESIISRKLKELFLGCMLERRYSKEELLGLYLNWIPFGSNAYGIEQASRVYFGKSASGLTLAESAVLAALPQRPTYFSPYGKHVRTDLTDIALTELLRGDIRSADDLDDEDVVIGLIGDVVGTGATTVYAGGRTDQVLHNMQQMAFITDTERNAALLDLRAMSFRPARETIRAPHFVLWVRQTVDEILAGTESADVLSRGGLRIETTLDWDLQQAAEKAVERQRKDLVDRFGAQNIALVAIDPYSRDVLAYVGNADYGDDEHSGKVDMARAPRQPGSTFKPLVYSAAFQKGYGPATVLYDVPTKFGEDEPQNFDGTFWGLTDARHALGGSRNIPAIKAYYLAGEDEREERILSLVADMGAPTPKRVWEEHRAADRAAGVAEDSLFSYGYPLAIGAAETPLLEMVQAYATFADEGRFRPVTAINRILDRSGNILYAADRQSPADVLDPRIAYQITSILSDPNARPNAYWREVLSVPGWEAGAKTGTSNKCLERFEAGKDKGKCKDRKPSDLWTIGFSPALVAGVWVGNADGTGLSTAAESLITAAPIWKNFMTAAHAVMKTAPAAFSVPPGIVSPQISALSGQLPTTCTPIERRRADVFLDESAPIQDDPACAELEIDRVTGLLASEECPAEAREKHGFLIARSIAAERWPLWESGVQEWAAKQMALYLVRPDHSGSLLPLPLAPTETCRLSLTPGRLEKPTVRILSPEDGGLASHPAFRPSLDIDSASGVREVRYMIDGKNVLTSSGSARVTITAPRSMDTAGQHTLRVVVVDRYFNEAFAETRFRFGEDKDPPHIRLVSPANGMHIPSGTTVTLRADAGDGNGALKYVQFFLGERLLTTKPAAPFELQYPVEWKPGEYSLRAVATDVAGNTAEDSIAITVTQ